MPPSYPPPDRTAMPLTAASLPTEQLTVSTDPRSIAPAAEAGPAFVAAGLVAADELDRTVAEMHRLAADETVLAVMPRMTQVWARKPARGAQGAA
ncbi:MAG: hypothetical protein U0746_17055 [Gemmataceae bacterium]